MTDSKPKPKIGAHWKRPPTRVYDYNYDVGQHYYQPMMRHLDKKHAGVSSDLPGPKTFAERLVEDPLYGRSKPVNYTCGDYSPSGGSRHGDDGPSSRRPGGTRDLGDMMPFDDGQDDSLMSRHRPSRLNMPSISDQILDSAGLKNTGDSFFTDALSDLKSKRRPMTADPEDLMNDPFFSKGSARSSNHENMMAKRRDMLRDMDSELEKIDSGLEKYGRGKGSSIDDMALTSTASSSSSLNVKKRSLKTTVTTETVRY